MKKPLAILALILFAVIVSGHESEPTPDTPAEVTVEPLRAPRPESPAGPAVCDRCQCAAELQLLRMHVEQLQNDVVMLREQQQQATAKPADAKQVKRQVLMFTADNCIYCRQDKQMLIPQLKRAGLTVGNENSNQVLFVDVDHLPEHQRAWKVTALPTYILVEDDGLEYREIRRHEGRLFDKPHFLAKFPEISPTR